MGLLLVRRNTGRLQFGGLTWRAHPKGRTEKHRAKIIVSGSPKAAALSEKPHRSLKRSRASKWWWPKPSKRFMAKTAATSDCSPPIDFGILERLENGESVPLEEFTQGLDPIAKGIVEYGGLFTYNKARLAGEVAPPPVATAKRPMNLVEKIIAQSAIADAKTGATGIDAVKPGDALFCRADVRFSHEYVTPMAESLFKAGFGDDAHVRDNESIFRIPRPPHFYR